MKRILIIEPIVETDVIRFNDGPPIPWAGAILDDDHFCLQSHGYHETVRSAVEEIADVAIWSLGRDWEEDDL